MMLDWAIFGAALGAMLAAGGGMSMLLLAARRQEKEARGRLGAVEDRLDKLALATARLAETGDPRMAEIERGLEGMNDALKELRGRAGGLERAIGDGHARIFEGLELIGDALGPGAAAAVSASAEDAAEEDAAADAVEAMAAELLDAPERTEIMDPGAEGFEEIEGLAGSEADPDEDGLAEAPDASPDPEETAEDEPYEAEIAELDDGDEAGLIDDVIEEPEALPAEDAPEEDAEVAAEDETGPLSDADAELAAEEDATEDDAPPPDTTPRSEAGEASVVDQLAALRAAVEAAAGGAPLDGALDGLRAQAESTETRLEEMPAQILSGIDAALAAAAQAAEAAEEARDARLHEALAETTATLEGLRDAIGASDAAASARMEALQDRLDAAEISAAGRDEALAARLASLDDGLAGGLAELRGELAALEEALAAPELRRAAAAAAKARMRIVDLAAAEARD